MRKESIAVGTSPVRTVWSRSYYYYGGPNFNGAGKQLTLAYGNVKDKFSSEGKEQIPAYP